MNRVAYLDSVPRAAEKSVHVVYFSNVSGNTERFVSKLGYASTRIPIYSSEPMPEMSEPFVLITPTYGGCLSVTGKEGSHVPRQVKKFLANKTNRDLARGVLAAGNSNFDTSFGAAGEAVAAKLGVPYLYRFELMGTQEDVDNVRKGLDEFWQHQRQTARKRQKTLRRRPAAWITTR